MVESGEWDTLHDGFSCHGGWEGRESFSWRVRVRVRDTDGGVPSEKIIKR